MSEETSRIAIVGTKRIGLVEVAKAQRLLIRIVGLVALSLFTTCVVSALHPYAGAAMLLLQPVFAIVAIVQAIRLARAAGQSLVSVIALGVLMLIPYVGLLALARTNSNATRLLRNHGARVGFLGVSKDEMRHLVRHACPNCGYDIRGLRDPVCPECGGQFAPDEHPPFLSSGPVGS
jgi:hypothetical protein